jgi:ABC-type nitrate/sulfonate/bicarbonate transport system ATPase subunit/ABC-type transporter Mla maintaining outer membrane lipid asymmetry permease subunit MlaE
MKRARKLFEPVVADPLLTIRALCVTRPDGVPLFRGLELFVRAGEVVVVLGGSGAGKSTLGRALFEPDALRREGFSLRAESVHAAVPPGLVPQRGALFDHLDVPGNIELALRHAQGEGPRDADVAGWLRRVDLDPELAAPGTPVTRLSGGQAQRLAVTRALAGGRRLLFLDEPSAGLDPARVRVLARQIRRQADEQRTAFVVTTHDVSLAVGVGDRLLLLDPAAGNLRPLFEDEWRGPLGEPGADDRREAWQMRLETEMVRLVGESEAPGAPGAAERRGGPGIRERILPPFDVASAALLSGWRQLSGYASEYATVFSRVLRQALLRPLPFYLIVATLLGFTILYVIAHVVRDLDVQSAVRFVGSSHVVALVPPITALLFVAASGNAVNAWLGGMSLTRQIAAMEALGIARRRYLWAPAWMALGLSMLVVTALFALGMIVGGWAFCRLDGVKDGWRLLTSDFRDPRPERIPYLVRAGGLVLLYAWGIASDCVASGTADKAESEHVTRAMTGSVVRCTLWVAALELLSAVVLFAVRK